jgi:hypothetical protein
VLALGPKRMNEVATTGCECLPRVDVIGLGLTAEDLLAAVLDGFVLDWQHRVARVNQITQEGQRMIVSGRLEQDQKVSGPDQELGEVVAQALETAGIAVKTEGLGGLPIVLVTRHIEAG